MQAGACSLLRTRLRLDFPVYRENTGNFSPEHSLSGYQIAQYRLIQGFLTLGFFGFFSGTGNYQGIGLKYIEALTISFEQLFPAN